MLLEALLTSRFRRFFFFLLFLCDTGAIANIVNTLDMAPVSHKKVKTNKLKDKLIEQKTERC